MYTTFHLASAQELTADILDAIKANFKSKPITIIVKEDDNDFELSPEIKTILDERMQEEESSYLTGEDSIKQLNIKYGL